MTSKRTLLVWTAFTLSCGGGGTSGTAHVQLETILSTEEAVAGEQVEVQCVVTGLNDLQVVTTVEIVPQEGAEVDNHVLRCTKAGEYAVACVLPDMEIKDETPAKLAVTPGPAARSVAHVEPGTVKAGEEAHVTCEVTDAYGNVVHGAIAHVDPVEGLTVANDKVMSIIPGHYSVTCSVESADVEKVGDELVVVPGDPARVVLTVTPDYKAYAVGDVVTLGFEVYDRYDNAVTGLTATFSAPEPPAVESLGPDRFRFAQEGWHKFSVTLDPPWDGITDSRLLLCDQSPPTITILFPDRGQMFTAEQKVVVRGTVSDIAGIKSVHVNGEQVEVKEDGSFEYPMMSRHGLNGIAVVASDVLGNSAKVTRGYYYSTKYLPVTAETPLKELVISEATMMFATQEVIDDGEHDHSHPDDLATIVEVLLANTDIVGMLGGIGPFQFTVPGVVNATLPIPGIEPGLKGDLVVGVEVTDIVLSDPYVGLKLRDGGLETRIRFSPVSFGLRLTFTLNAYLHAHNPLDGKDYNVPIVAPSSATTSRLTIGTLEVTMDLDIEKLPGQPLKAEGKNFDVTLSDIKIDPITGLVVDLGSIDLFGLKVDLGTYDLSSLVGGINDVIANYVLNPLVNFITQPIVDLLEPLVTWLIGDTIKQFLGLLAIEQTVELPPLIGGKPLLLSLKVDLSSVVFKADGARLGLNIGTKTEKAVEREPLGSIMRDGCLRLDAEPEFFEFQPEPSMQVGAKYDLLNEVLFMVWWSGMLSGPLDLSGLMGNGGSLPISGLEVTPDLLLPPILDDCSLDGKTHLQVGDAWLELKFQLLNADQHIGVWLQVDFAAQIVAQGSEIGLRLDKVAYLEYELYDIGGNMGTLLPMVEGLLPTLLDQVAGQEFRFEIPPFDIGGLVPGVPQGTYVELGNLTARTERGILVFGGDLQ